MKVCLFEAINMHQVGPGQFLVQGTTKDVPVNPEQVLYVMPAVIPSDVAGPDGQAMSKLGARVQLSGTALLVAQSRELVLWRLFNDLVDLTGEKAPLSEPEPEPEETPRPRLRLVRPNMLETPAEPE
jgi:hypothetical protein